MKRNVINNKTTNNTLAAYSSNQQSLMVSKRINSMQARCLVGLDKLS